MRLEIVARSGPLFSGEVSEVVAPAIEGEIGILPNHSPLMAAICKGEVRFVSNGEKKRVEVGNGFLTVDQNDITIVVENYEDSAS